MKSVTKTTLLLALSLLLCNTSVAAAVGDSNDGAERNDRIESLTDLPPNEAHPQDALDIARPRLSIIGMRSSDPNHGYAVEDVLRKAYGIGEQADGLVRETYIRVIEQAHLESTEEDSTLDEGVNYDSNIFQSRAFEVLMTYILEENGIDPAQLSELTGPDDSYSHAAALARFKDMLDVQTVRESGDDVKRTTSMNNTARARWTSTSLSKTPTTTTATRRPGCSPKARSTTSK